MKDLADKMVFITGASSGIGKACARLFAERGAHLILTARRVERIKQLAADLQQQYHIEALPILLDVCQSQDVLQVIQNLKGKWKNIDILINNAGLALTNDPIQAGLPSNWDTMIQTNIQGLLYVTHAVLPNMIANNRGHIVNIGSVAGHMCYPGGNVYAATKHAVKAISESLRIDLLGKAIRVTEISPGAVHTEFSKVRWQDEQRAEKFYAEFTPLEAEDIADAVLYCVTRPQRVDIAEMIIYPTDQASANHISKK